MSAPLLPPEGGARPRRSSPTLQLARGGPGPLPRVLIVDDRRSNRYAFARLLEAVECEVLEAATGQEALALIEGSDVDLVLLDVTLPDVDGFEVCRRIKAMPGGQLTPIVMVTARSDVQDRVTALDAGADDFMSKPVDRVEMVARVRSALRLRAVYDTLESSERVIYTLAAAVEAKDPYTTAHAGRVARSAVAVATALGLADLDLQRLEFAAAIHDIGKIAVPDRVLLKPGPLDPVEQSVMRTHPVVGAEIVRPLRSAGPLTDVILHHHEAFDGSGYPARLSGHDIPAAARLVAVCDAFDAMTSERPYRSRLPFSVAAANLARGAGTQWDPDLVSAFLEVAAPEYERRAS